MEAVVLDDQPAVSVVVAVFLFFSETDQELPEPLADLHHEGNAAEEDVSAHLSDYGSGGQLTHLGCVVLSLHVCNARGAKSHAVRVTHCLQLLQQDFEDFFVIRAPGGISIVEGSVCVSDHAASPQRQVTIQRIFNLAIIFFVLICEELSDSDQGSNPQQRRVI